MHPFMLVYEIKSHLHTIKKLVLMGQNEKECVNFSKTENGNRGQNTTIKYMCKHLNLPTDAQDVSWLELSEVLLLHSAPNRLVLNAAQPWCADSVGGWWALQQKVIKHSDKNKWVKGTQSQTGQLLD